MNFRSSAAAGQAAASLRRRDQHPIKARLSPEINDAALLPLDGLRNTYEKLKTRLKTEYRGWLGLGGLDLWCMSCPTL